MPNIPNSHQVFIQPTLSTDFYDGSFCDKTSVTLPSCHRFYELSQALMAYQGLDILPIAEVQQLPNLTTQPILPHACVLVALTDEVQPKVLLTRRASGLSSHAAEVSFVGGKRDDKDGSSYEVAMREAFEEVGISQATVLGYLPMQISKKGLLVRPVIASISLDQRERLSINHDEIAHVFWVELSQFLTPPQAWQIPYDTPQGRIQTPAWIINTGKEDEIIWGLTGRILANLMQIGFGVEHKWYYRVLDK